MIRNIKIVLLLDFKGCRTFLPMKKYHSFITKFNDSELAFYQTKKQQRRYNNRIEKKNSFKQVQTIMLNVYHRGAGFIMNKIRTIL